MLYVLLEEDGSLDLSGGKAVEPSVENFCTCAALTTYQTRTGLRQMMVVGSVEQLTQLLRMLLPAFEVDPHYSLSIPSP